jgi:hypothetical protein
VPEEPTRQRVAYLPPRAAKARKLILRSQLGLPWMLTAALFGVVILAAGTLFLVKGGRPGAPWVRLAPLTRFADGAVTQVAGPSGQVVVVDRRGSPRAFMLAPGPCPVVGAGGGFARPCAGQAWDSAGRPAAAPGRVAPAAPPMRPVPLQIARGDLYINLERRASIGAAPPTRAGTGGGAGAHRGYLTATLRAP